ncbi:neuronal acetylcholine receptor subunit alpha-2-like [Dreissena polymorpha]|nr:neuronal acetylcholine receptor subunit alpha-2-like [Dreissena polymorpha]
MNIMWILCVIVMVLRSFQVEGNMSRLYTHMTNGYNKLLLPVTDHRTQVNVSIRPFLVSINSFDEIKSEIALTWLFSLEWTEERMSLNPVEFNNITSFVLPASEIWYPRILLQQSAGSIQEVGTSEHSLRIFHNGTVNWLTGNVFEIVCSVDVTFFPFDKQMCNISLIYPAYGLSELVLAPVSSTVDITMLAKNSQWAFIEGNIFSNGYDGQTPYLNIELHLGRRNEFYVVYIIIPVTLLGAINNFVFLLPANSGERSSVAITVFLSFVVYFEIMNTTIPQSSSPVAYIYYYLMFLLMYSCIVFFFCIMALRIHDRKGSVSSCLQKLVQWHRKRSCCQRKRPVSRSDDAVVKIPPVSEENDDTKQHDTRYQSDCEKKSEESEITWSDVGDLFDEVSAKTLNLIFWAFSISTLVQLYNNG